MAEAKKPKKTTAKSKSDAPAKKPASDVAVPLIDTNLAAATAAKLIAHHATPASTAPVGEHAESAGFKRLKEGLNKPALGGLPAFLSSASGGKKGNLPMNQQNQFKRGQTFGPDVTRTGVPRRTGG